MIKFTFLIYVYLVTVQMSSVKLFGGFSLNYKIPHNFSMLCYATLLQSQSYQSKNEQNICILTSKQIINVTLDAAFFVKVFQRVVTRRMKQEP